MGGWCSGPALGRTTACCEAAACVCPHLPELPSRTSRLCPYCQHQAAPTFPPVSSSCLPAPPQTNAPVDLEGGKEALYNLNSGNYLPLLTLARTGAAGRTLQPTAAQLKAMASAAAEAC